MILSSPAIIILFKEGDQMSQLGAGEFDVKLNGVRIHCTVRGSGPVMIAHSGGPGMYARLWDGFAKIDDFVTIVVIHPRGSGLSRPAAEDTYLLPDYAADIEAAVQEFKDQPWFEKSFAALQAEWAGEYRTDQDMARLWTEDLPW
jgi:hypothetical protein